MNEVINCLLSRRSIRNYKADPVKKEDMEQIIKCGQYSASARNIQPWHFTVVTDKKIMDEMVEEFQNIIDKGGPSMKAALPDRAKVDGFHNFYHAPAVIVVSGKEDAKFRESDIGGCVQNMAVAAHALGLATCIIANILPVFSGQKGNEFISRLKVPEGFVPTMTMAVGYNAGPNPDAPARITENVNYI